MYDLVNVKKIIKQSLTIKTSIREIEKVYYSIKPVVLVIQLISRFKSLVLLDYFIQNVPDILPAALRHQDGVPVVASDLGYGQVLALVVALHVEVESFVFYFQVFAGSFGLGDRVSVI